MDYPSKPLPGGCAAAGRSSPRPTRSISRRRQDVHVHDPQGRALLGRLAGDCTRLCARDRAPARPSDEVLSAAEFADLVGGEDVLAGKTKTPSGVSAQGRVLTLRLTRPDPRLPGRVGQPLRGSPEPAGRPRGCQSAAPERRRPTTSKEYVPGERLVLERNRFYGGERPHHVDRFVADLTARCGTDHRRASRAASSTAACVSLGRLARAAASLAQRYGVTTRAQFFVRAGERPAHVRAQHERAAVPEEPEAPAGGQLRCRPQSDRARERGLSRGTPTDQYLSPSTAGLHGTSASTRSKAPTLSRASALAKGHTRAGKAVLYATPQPSGRRPGAGPPAQPEGDRDRGRDRGRFRGPCSSRSWRRRARLRHRLRWLVPLTGDPSWFTDIFDGRTIGAARQPELVVFQLAEVQPALRRGVAAHRERALPAPTASSTCSSRGRPRRRSRLRTSTRSRSSRLEPAASS